MPHLTALDHIVLTVRDLTATRAFYTDVLGMRATSFHPADGSERHALTFGSQKINLHVAGQEFEPCAAHPVSGSADLCFLTDTPLQTWMDHLSALQVAIECGPVDRTGATGAIRSLYVRDPDGNLIEISTLA